MKKSYHSIVVPIVDAMTALRSCALCSVPDIVSYVVALAIGVLLQPAPRSWGQTSLPPGKQFRGNTIPSNPCHGRPRFSGRGRTPLLCRGFAFEKPVSCRGFRVGRGKTRVSESQG